jgi:putative RNA 2'-phosphotransferase
MNFSPGYGVKRKRAIGWFLSEYLREWSLWRAIELVLDESGWAGSDALIRLANERGKRLTRELIREVVAKNDKQRFTIDASGNRMRANQGRSVEANLGLAPVEPPELLFHGTVERFLGSIRRHGLRRGSRTHVHGSETSKRRGASAPDAGSRSCRTFRRN